MQSSTAIAFRALVMLICMISIPLFAIFGKDLPEVVKNLLAGRLVVRVTDPAPDNRPGVASTGAATGNSSRPNSPFSEPASYRAEASGAPAAAQPTSVRSSTVNAATAQPAGFQAPSESRPISSGEGSGLTNQEPVGNNGAGATVGSDNEQFHKAEARLRELGATHYTLETWGSENNRYRFVCKMAVGGNPGVNRYFQAIEDDPWRAMNAVLQQVETWRSQQPQ